MQRKQIKKENFSSNIRFYYVSVSVIVLGYVFLSIGSANSFTSLTLGPLVLILGYIFAIPFALLSGSKGDKKQNNE